MAKAGFHHLALVEWDRDCCNTIRLNKRRRLKFVRDWTIVEEDVAQFDYSPFRDQVDVVAGGVPCQPFSIGGKHQAYRDQRDMFPQFAKAVSELAPKAFIVENVKGLLRGSFRDYFDYVLLRLSHPTVRQKRGEHWKTHFRRLETIHSSGTQTGLDYHVVWRLLNAADYGVPQRRERVFVVGVRSDLNTERV